MKDELSHIYTLERSNGKYMKNILKSKILIFTLILSVITGLFINMRINAASISITNSGGWFESTYIEWVPVSGAVGYNVYVKPASASDSLYTKIDNELIRQYTTYWRADAVGLAAGNYVMKVEAILSSGSSISAVSNSLIVESYDRSGFAFSSNSQYKTGSGAYNDNGTLRNGAKVIYVTSKTAKTVQLDVIVSSAGKVQTGVGIADILSLRQKGYDKTPLAIRFIGKVTSSDMSGQLNSNGFLQVKGNSSYTEMNITLEGIGEDATAYGWGFLIRNCGNVEVRNMGIMLFADDGLSLDTNNCNIWLHNNDIFYGKAGSDADQVKGDGSADVKGASTFLTISYNHFWDSGKVSLCGMSDTAEFFATYHHNWFDHSDSRHPRIRVGSIHIYNNYYDGNSKYGVGTTKGSSAFVESNYFRHSKYPMMSSLQGTDALGDGTFSGENGGMIKAYNNIIEDASSLIYANSNAGTTNANSTSFDAYLALTRGESVPSSYKTRVGGTTYNNFDLNKDLGVRTSNITNVNDVERVVTNKAGRMNQGDFTWNFNDSVDDISDDVNSALMTKIVNYTTNLVVVGGNSSQNPTITPTVAPTAIPTTSPTITPTVVPTVIPTTSPTITPTPIVGGYVHNFTTSGKNSDFFIIEGNLSTSKGTVNYNGLTLTQCLKIETVTKIQFTTTQTSTLTLVLNSTDGVEVKVDGMNYATSNGVITVSLNAGTHTITKADVANLFYMIVK